MLFPLIFRMLRARWPVVAIATGCSLAGGAYIAFTAPPRYEATARVEMQYVKAARGETLMNKKAATAYVTSQVRMIRDYQVAVPAAEALGLLDNPDVQAAFAATGGDPDDFPRWVASRIIGSVFARPVAESNMLEIGYVAPTPETALQSVDAVRSAYMQATVEAQRSNALSTANNLATRVTFSTKELERLQAAKRDLETASGSMPEVESQRLTDMVTKKYGSPYVMGPSRSRLPIRLAEAEAELAQATTALGPNNPRLSALRAARDAIKRQVQIESAASQAAASTDTAEERARQTMIEAQKSKVLSLRQYELEMRLLDDEIAGRNLVIKGMNEQIVALRQNASYQDVGLAPVGDAEVEPKAVFPNPALILGGTGFLGLALGSMLAIFLELLNRRARSAREFELSADAKLLGVVPLASAGRVKPARKAARPDRTQKSRQRSRAAA